MPIQIRNACILTPFAQQEGVVIIDGGKIVEVTRHAEVGRGTKVIDARGMYLAPGYVDIHAHGGGGGDVMGGMPEDIAAMCRGHAACGTTTIVPTTLAAPHQEIAAALDNICAAKATHKLSTIAGAHVQGFFASSAHDAAHGAKGGQVDETAWMPLLDGHADIKLFGAPPELPGALQLGDALRRKGIVASISNSRADYEQILSAVAHGYTDVTNLYTGNSATYQQGKFCVPGVTECGLAMDELTVQVVADGWQLPLLVLQIIMRCKSAENVVLVSDAAGGHTPSDRFDEGFSTMAHAVRNMVASGVSLRMALRMATVNPARRIGLNDSKGRISVGYDADLLLLDGKLNVCFCMAKGKTIKNELAQE